ncbi:muscular LMNA-interacting protein [Centroberyx gerrardi]
MSDGEIFKAEVVYIKDSEEGGAGHIIQGETHLQKIMFLFPQLKHPTDHMNFPQTSPSFSTRAENTPNHLAAGPASMETAVDKHRGISQQQCHDTSLGAEVSSGFFVNRASASEDRTSPTNSTDLFPTPASSRESILSEGWDKEKSWSAMQLSGETSPVSFSRTVSPCSSVRSGVFSPAVVRVKRHTLAPGSSLLNMPQSCFSSCESLSSSLCPQSPPSRHRLPLTRLSLLTAILRKGRLPILSPALQRPYSPCWPVNPVTLSWCNACSAASSVASIPLEFSSRFPSSASIDSQAQSQCPREPYRCVTAPPSVQLKELNKTGPHTPLTKCSEQIHSNSGPRWERVISPTPQTVFQTRSKPVKNNPLPRAPLFCSPVSQLKPISPTPVNHEETFGSAASEQLQHPSIGSSKCQSLKFKPSNSLMYPKGHTRDNNHAKLISLSPKPINEQETSVQQERSRQPCSSLSRLHSLSQQLRSFPSRSPASQPSQSHPPNVTVSSATKSPPPPSHNTVKGRWQSEESYPVSARDRIPQVHKAHCLSPSRYTPIIFPGWPSPTNSPSPTPDRFTLTPSPAPPIRDLTPSPSLSLRSTPSPRPWSGISDCSDREGKKRKPHKIKLSYKSLAAIPTNTLLLDQQAIDDEVEREEEPRETLDRGVTDTHAEMCSPAQLRQQSEELYAVIDEILGDSIPTCKTSRSPQPSRESTSNVGLQHMQQNTSFPRSPGRETKYASLCSLHPSASVERKLMDTKKTKPGVIRPMTAIPRLTVEDEEEYHPNPFRHYIVEQSLTDNKKSSHPIVTIHENEALISKEVENLSLVEAGEDANTSSKGQTFSNEKNPESAFSTSDLLIIKSEDQIAHTVKDGSWQDASTSFSPTEVLMEAFETHI